MPTNKNKDDNVTMKSESTRKPLPQSSVIGKRKEIYDLTSIKDKKKIITNPCAYLFVPC